MSDLKYVTRRKIVIIPYTRDNQYLFVKDKETSEWGFVTGGVKKNESFKKAAVREFIEETSNIFSYIPFHKCKQISYTNSYRPGKLLEIDQQRGQRVVSNYVIYLFQIDYKHIENFTENNEIVDICITNFEKLRNVWKLSHMIYNEHKLTILK